MKVFTKRNALVGFVTLKALERRRRRRRQSALKVGLIVAAGVLSAGIFAALAIVVLRRTREQEPQRLEGYAIAPDTDGDAARAADVTPEPSAA